MSTFTDAFKNSMTGRWLHTLAIDISNYWTILGVIACAYFYGRYVGEQGITGHAFPIIYFGWLMCTFAARIVVDSELERQRKELSAEKMELFNAKLELQRAHDKATWRVVELESQIKHAKT